MFPSNFLSVAAGGVVCQVFVSRFLVPREPFEFRLLVESVVFPTDTPLGSKGGGCNLCDRVWFCSESVFQALRMPRLCGESGLCV